MLAVRRNSKIACAAVILLSLATLGLEGALSPGHAQRADEFKCKAIQSTLLFSSAQFYSVQATTGVSSCSSWRTSRSMRENRRTSSAE